MTVNRRIEQTIVDHKTCCRQNCKIYSKKHSCNIYYMSLWTYSSHEWLEH